MAVLALPGIKTLVGLIAGAITLAVGVFAVHRDGVNKGLTQAKDAELKDTTEAYQDAAQVRRGVGALPPGASAEQLQRDFRQPGR